MKENPNCKLCDLHKNAEEDSVCLKGEGGQDAKVLIFLDSPTIVDNRRGKGMVSDAALFVRLMLERMSVKPQSYYLDYVLKCYTAQCKAFSKKPNRLDFIQSCSVYRFATLQRIRPKAIIGMGRICCETFVGSDKVSNFEGTYWTPTEPRVRDFVERVWITYSPLYAQQDAAESVGIYRTLFQCCRDAGLHPRYNPKVKTQPLFEYYGT